MREKGAGGQKSINGHIRKQRGANRIMKVNFYKNLSLIFSINAVFLCKKNANTKAHTPVINLSQKF